MDKNQVSQEEVNQEGQEHILTKAEEESTEKEPAAEVLEKQKIDQDQTALAEASEKYVRLYADFENFRKRVAKERIKMFETANQDMIQKLLPIIDDFERALAVAMPATTPPEGMTAGIRLIHEKLMHLLQQKGVQPIETPKGTQFDPELHEAVTQTPVEDPSLRGKVIDIVEKGYFLRDKVLRFAKVVIGS